MMTIFKPLQCFLYNCKSWQVHGPFSVDMVVPRKLQTQAFSQKSISQVIRVSSH